MIKNLNLAHWLTQGKFSGSRLAKKKNLVALSFDDGPHYRNTLNVIKTLNKNKSQATFFWIAEYATNLAKNHPILLKKIITEIKNNKHEIGLHALYDYKPTFASRLYGHFSKKQLKRAKTTDSIYRPFQKYCKIKAKNMNFQKKLDKIIAKNNSLLSIGLDPDKNIIPNHLLSIDPLFEFNKAIIDATFDLVCVYKPNTAFYEAYGIKGIESLKKTIEYIKSAHPEIPIIADAKRADIGKTSEKYAKSVFDYFGCDAVTVNPYLGPDSIETFFKNKNKGKIIPCRTSNPSACDFQDL